MPLVRREGIGSRLTFEAFMRTSFEAKPAPHPQFGHVTLCGASDADRLRFLRAGEWAVEQAGLKVGPPERFRVRRSVPRLITRYHPSSIAMRNGRAIAATSYSQLPNS
jgi:hypothetical protein